MITWPPWNAVDSRNLLSSDVMMLLYQNVILRACIVNVATMSYFSFANYTEIYLVNTGHHYSRNSEVLVVILIGDNLFSQTFFANSLHISLQFWKQIFVIK